MTVSHLVGSFALAFLILSARPLAADTPLQRYTLVGWDAFRIAGRQLRSEIAYTGSEVLSAVHQGTSTRFVATATYQREQGGTSTPASASFSATLLPNGQLEDGKDDDPDYLTILNQPFSIVLDRPTFHDLSALRGAVPFDFPAPMTGAPLHGSLRRLADGTLDGKRVLGIAFAASGPVHGGLSDRPSLALEGTISMNGTAYYAYSNALLLALDATLQIDGKLNDSAEHDPVTIVYKRTIRPGS